jgi:hypothetical protein
MKTCSKCKEEKELNDFNRRDGTKDGYLSYCKKCYSAQGTNLSRERQTAKT